MNNWGENPGYPPSKFIGWYHVLVPRLNNTDNINIYNWCEENCIDDYCFGWYRTFKETKHGKTVQAVFFVTEEDQIKFILWF